MPLLPILGALILVLLSGKVRGQEPEPPLPSPETQEAAQSPSPSEQATPAAPQLIPPISSSPSTMPGAPPIPNPPTIPQLDEAFKTTPLSVAAENARHQVEWRDLRNRLVSNPQIKTALATAETARTDLEKRQLLKKYYELYFGKMIELAGTPELKAYLNDRKNEQLAQLPQPRTRPTPTPTPTPKH